MSYKDKQKQRQWEKNHYKICIKCIKRKKLYMKKYQKRYMSNLINRNKKNLYRKKWRQRLDIKQKEIEFGKKYYYSHLDKRRQNNREYRKLHLNYFAKWFRNKRKKDLNFLIAERIRNSLRANLRYYTKTGKIMSSSKYGIDYKLIIEKLVRTKPKNFNSQKYHIEHIIPLSSFDLIDKQQIQFAFCPENIEWLTEHENCAKGNRIETIYP